MGTNKQNGIKYFISTLILLIVITAYSIITNLWFLIAIPVGFLLGFFLQKGDLCGSSAFSEVLLMKDQSKVFGLWIAILVSMIGIAVMDIFGLVTLNPKPLLWINYITGGIIFGVGMVLAGGCVSGCLYKAGTGNINSMAGLIGIPIGIALVEYGPLNPIFIDIKMQVISNSSGDAVTLSSLTGLPFGLIALFFLFVTIILLYFRKNKSRVGNQSNDNNYKRFLFKPWKPWQAGIAIGLLVIPAYLSSAETGRNYPLGVTHGILHTQMLVTESNLNHIFQKPNASIIQQNQKNLNQIKSIQPQGKKISWWLILLVTSLIVGSWISCRLGGKVKLLPKPPEQTVIAFLGGILIGTGAALATGCVIGNILSGWALMSVGMILFGFVVVVTNWITTYFYLMGGSLLKIKKDII